ncbi:MAG TPA: BatD family protein, partial [Bacteroidota bacterium]|nr:BatD family protein [Bacteroidota bacterium]
MKRTIITMCALALMGVAAVGQTTDFQASLDRTQVGSGEQFTLSFTLTNAGTGGGKNLQLPDLSKFHIMSGPNESSAMQIINGAVSSSVTYSYILQPKETGKFTIGAATIEAGGKIFRTGPLAIEVVKGAARASQQAGSQDDAAAQIGDNLFLKASVDRTHVMQGEQ